MVEERQRQRTDFRRPEYFAEPYRPDPNKRPPKDFPTGIMLAMNNNPTMNKIIFGIHEPNVGSKRFLSANCSPHINKI